MANPADGIPQFRQWLVDRLKWTKWATIPGEEREATAKRLLVDPEALRLAQEALDRERKAMGRIPRVLGARARSGPTRPVYLAFPETIWPDWQGFAKARAISAGVVLRSLIAELLSGPRNPTWIGREWRYRGARHRLKGSRKVVRGKNWPWTTGTLLPNGAYEALQQRAAVIGCKMTALLRGQAIDLLEGRLPQLRIVTSPEEMFDDVAKLWRQ